MMISQNLPRAWSILWLAMLIGCADKQAPRFSSASSVAVNETGSKTLRVKWGHASDNRGVAQYEVVLRSGDPQLPPRVVMVASSVGHVEFENLMDSQDYVATVVALDAAGNRSEALSAEATTKDTSPPTWNRGARVEIKFSDVVNDSDKPDAMHEATITWGGAYDRGGVKNFDVFEDEKKLATVSAPPWRGRLASADGTITVIARDHSGNVSYPLGTPPTKAQVKALAKSLRPAAQAAIATINAKRDPNTIAAGFNSKLARPFLTDELRLKIKEATKTQKLQPTTDPK